MRVPLTWLREHCDPPLSTVELVERLDMTGTEVARVERVGVPDARGFVVGKVLEAVQHPNADRLRVCRVDDGSPETRTIVCGAPNVAAGQTVAVARPGAVMPGGLGLAEVKLRGVLSQGMILAEDELELGDDHAGIMVLPEELSAGMPLDSYVPIAEEVLDLEITPNRPDCLSIYGVARELHAATGAPLGPDPGAHDAGASGADRAHDHVSIAVDPEVCPRFTGRVYEEVTLGPSPLWLRERLIAAGQRPISNVVDITNYVMLLTGHPLHAFDLDRVRGSRVVVRRARDGERLTTLDGVERVLDAEMTVICDAEGPTSLAGIMGGQVSEVADTTTRVLLEAANWVGPNILRTSSRLGLRSEASARFEKALHPEQATGAQRIAARLMVDLCGARLVPGELDEYPARRPLRVVRLRPARVERLIGAAVAEDEILAILERLGFSAAPDGDGLAVTVPPFRDADVQREADLIEEIARVHGLQSLPITLPARRRAVGRLSSRQLLRRRLEDALRDRGLFEVVSWSFTSREAIARLRLPDERLLRVANPLSEDAAVMRPLLLPGLLDAAARNAARGRSGVALFESAHVYGALDDGSFSNGSAPALQPGVGGVAERPPDGARPAREAHHLAALITPGLPGTWRAPEPAADFFAIKGVLEGVLAAAGAPWQLAPAERPFLHPGRSAAVMSGQHELGWIGELHPLVVRAIELPGAAAFELDFDLLASFVPGALRYRDLTAFPPVLQDVAFVVPEEVSAAQVEEAVRAGGAPLLQATAVFDLYRGEQAGEGNKSLALRLEFRAADRTLTDDEVAERRRAIEARVAELGGRLRG